MRHLFTFLLVLACGALLAQEAARGGAEREGSGGPSVESAPRHPARDAGALGLHWTGRAAALAGRGASLTPADVLRWLPEALRERGPGTTDLPMPFVTFDLPAAR